MKGEETWSQKTKSDDSSSLLTFQADGGAAGLGSDTV